LPPQAPLAPGRAARLEHCLAALAQIAGKAGAVVPGTFNRPDTGTACVLLRESKRLSVTATVRRDRSLLDKRADRRNHDR